MMAVNRLHDDRVPLSRDGRGDDREGEGDPNQGIMSQQDTSPPIKALPQARQVPYRRCRRSQLIAVGSSSAPCL